MRVFWIAFALILNSCSTAETDTKIYLQNDSPYWLKYAISGISLKGRWVVPPVDTVQPNQITYSEVQGSPPGETVSGGLKYQVILGSEARLRVKEVGNFILSFKNPDPFYHLTNEASLVSSVVQINSYDSLFDISWFSHVGSAVCDPSNVESWNASKVSPSGHPMCILIKISWLQTSGSLLLEHSSSEMKGIYKSMANCLFQNPSVFNSTFLLDEATTSYNSIGWTLGDTSSGWYISPFVDETQAKTFYEYYGYEFFDCQSFDEADVLLHCHTSLTGACTQFVTEGGTFTFTHASVKSAGGNWSSKIGYLPLFSYQKWNGMMNQNCGIENTVGFPHLCFRRIKSHNSPKKTPKKLTEPQQESLKLILCNIPYAILGIFENKFSTWHSNHFLMPLYTLQDFSAIPGNFLTPLVVSKMLHETTYHAIYIYETLPDRIVHEYKIYESEQDRAFRFAQEWLSD